jgi:hypothetical protein
MKHEMRWIDDERKENQKNLPKQQLQIPPIPNSTN